MDKIGKNVIETIYTYLTKKNAKALRLCSRYLNKTVSPLYFCNVIIRSYLVSVNTRHIFRNFVHKYNLTLNLRINNIFELSHFLSYNIKSIYFDTGNKICKPVDDNLKSLNTYGKYIIPLNTQIIHIQKYNSRISELDPTYFKEFPKLKELNINYNKIIKKDELPSSLKTLTLYNFNSSILEGVLPTSLTELTFDYMFNKSINKGVLPTSLIKLTFGDRFNKVINKLVLPSSLTELTFGTFYSKTFGTFYSKAFGGTFNQQIAEHVLPESLTKLTFGYRFNQIINENVLPTSLIILKFGIEYNQPIYENVLSSSLKELIFGWQFNQPINENVLPASLKEIRFGRYFNQPIKKNVIPLMLEKLKFSMNFNRSIKNINTPILRSLSFGMYFDKEIIKLPPVLEELAVNIDVLKKDRCGYGGDEEEEDEDDDEDDEDDKDEEDEGDDDYTEEACDNKFKYYQINKNFFKILPTTINFIKLRIGTNSLDEQINIHNNTIKQFPPKINLEYKITNKY
jgi:hypothetical protein